MLPQLQSVLESAKQNWIRVAQYASFALLAIPYLWPPPTVAADTGTAKATAAFIATAVVAIIITAGHYWAAPDHQIGWFVTVLLLIALTVVLFVFYGRAVGRFTCEYNHHRVIIGDRLTPQAEWYSQRVHITSCAKLLDDFAGNVEDIWTLDSRIHGSTVLSSLYVSVVGVLASMLVAVTQLLGVFQARV